MRSTTSAGRQSLHFRWGSARTLADWSASRIASGSRPNGDPFRLRNTTSSVYAHAASTVLRDGQPTTTALLVERRLFVQASGQRYGLWPAGAIGDRLDGWAASHDLFRIGRATLRTRARLFAFLRSEPAPVMLEALYGTSIPHVNPAGIAAGRPDSPERSRQSAGGALSSSESRRTATSNERSRRSRRGSPDRAARRRGARE